MARDATNGTAPLSTRSTEKNVLPFCFNAPQAGLFFSVGKRKCRRSLKDIAVVKTERFFDIRSPVVWPRTNPSSSCSLHQSSARVGPADRSSTSQTPFGNNSRAPTYASSTSRFTRTTTPRRASTAGYVSGDFRRNPGSFSLQQTDGSERSSRGPCRLVN